MRRSVPVGLTVGLVAMFLVIGPALAQDPRTGGVTANEVSTWFNRGGFKAEVEPDTTTPGDQMVATTTDGVSVDIFLYQCAGEGDERRCQSIQYVTGWAPQPTFTLQKVNAWNASNRYIKAYLTADGSLYGEYDVDVSPGDSYETLNHSLADWRAILASFKTFFGRS
jgi:hypothetical protein